MFGIIYLLVGIIGKIGWETEKTIKNNQSKRNTYNPETGTYYDMFGAERKLNGEYCSTHMLHGDLVQTDRNFNVTRNFSQEKRDVIIKEAINDSSKTVIPIFGKPGSISDPYEIYGHRYKDKNTGKLYVIRRIRIKSNYSAYFYMNIENAHLVRLTDGEIKYGTEINYKEVYEFISKFNHEQDNRSKTLPCYKFFNDKNAVDLSDYRNSLV